jgi:hypothetical protein
MKIRNGFVSNSSSSSFVIIGAKRSGDYDEIMENENLGDGIESIYVEEEGYDYITGFVLADDEDYLESNNISFAEFNEKAQKVADALKIDINQVELIMGTRPS